MVIGQRIKREETISGNYMAISQWIIDRKKCIRQNGNKTGFKVTVILHYILVSIDLFIKYFTYTQAEAEASGSANASCQCHKIEYPQPRLSGR